MAAAILLLTASASQATSTIPDLQITENSSTSLTVLLNGNPIPGLIIDNPTPDNWTITLPFTVDIPGVSTTEPGAASVATFNNVWTTPGPSSPFVDVVNVQSDGLQMFTTVLGDNKEGAAGLRSPDHTLDLTFDDEGDGTVPDGASTALLALPAILALFAMARLRKSSIPA